MLVLGKSNKKIGIIDYGAGNLRNISKAISKIHYPSVRIKYPDQLSNCDTILIPGMGAAGNALNVMKKNNLFEGIDKFKETGAGIMGICLGFQLFYNNHSEANNDKGFGFLDGDIEHFSNFEGYNCRIPNIGWNKIYQSSNIKGMVCGNNSNFYFAHSYTPVHTNIDENLAYSHLKNQKIISVSKKENVIGCQFHPEKSGIKGLDFLKWLIKQI
jgi:imidazole glycerol-phosphate synthase subunit HisH